MREIKFRAWHKEKKEMVGINTIYFGAEMASITTYKDTAVNSCVLENEELEFMQFTGLQDKNGVDIYEGDIIKADYRAEGYLDTLHGYIVFFHGGFCVRTVKNSYSDDCPVSDLIKDSTEIIGNIYENPELLEV